MTRPFRRIADRLTDLLVPRSTAGACAPCYVRGTCAGGGQRLCCYVGSSCALTCGCT
ncbi:hypothetical protein AB0I28_24695 [Phytomonospora sp. NPDC050363]|uniref:hypothetical protein n=1 Tax=Phytomonospora sp. NPDC050363 TaxID=3155642 RepID=UPI0033CAF284